MRHAGTDMRVWSLVFGKVVNAKMSAEFKSLQMEQLVESQFGGCLLLKSTIFRMGEGNFAESNWIENLLAERFTHMQFGALLLSMHTSAECLAQNTECVE